MLLSTGCGLEIIQTAYTCFEVDCVLAPLPCCAGTLNLTALQVQVEARNCFCCGHRGRDVWAVLLVLCMMLLIEFCACMRACWCFSALHVYNRQMLHDCTQLWLVAVLLGLCTHTGVPVCNSSPQYRLGNKLSRFLSHWIRSKSPPVQQPTTSAEQLSTTTDNSNCVDPTGDSRRDGFWSKLP